ncbi:MAG TPA: sugar ABC transporter substrate-binding protein [Casimicrobiaceae bacterium]|nr:sugar ABC transporter substrate-binding protein [Casimicrobiaceae bacterium]
MASTHRTRRRSVLRGLAAAAALPLAHAASVRAQAGPLKLTFGWPFANGTQGIEELAKRFSDEKKTIEVEVQVIPQTQVIPRLTTAFTGGQAPDCMGMSDAWLAQFATPGWLDNVEGYIKSSGIDKEIVPASMALARMIKGQAHFVGFQVEPYALYYNKQIFAQAGIAAPPRDVDEFRNVALKLTDRAKNRYGYYALGGSGWQFQQWCSWMVNHGGLGVNNTLYDDKGKCILASPKHVQGLEKWLALYQTDKVSPPASATATFQDQTNAFNAQQLGMVLGWGAYLTMLPQGIGEANVGTAMPPAGPAGQFFFYGGNGFAINAASKNKDASWEFIRYLLKPEHNSRWNQQYGAIPAIQAAWNDEWLKAPKYQAPMEMLKRTNALISNPRYLPGYASFQNQVAPEQIQKALLGKQTAQEFGKAIADAADALRAKA